MSVISDTPWHYLTQLQMYESDEVSVSVHLS